MVCEPLPAPWLLAQVPQDAPAIGGQRFLDLAQGKEGVAFRKTKFELLEDGFIQNSGLKALSYQASGRTAITGGRLGRLGGQVGWGWWRPEGVDGEGVVACDGWAGDGSTSGFAEAAGRC